MEFGRLMTDIPAYVSCKIEMYIFKSEGALYILANMYVLHFFMY